MIRCYAAALVLFASGCQTPNLKFVCTEDAQCAVPDHTRVKCVKNDGASGACAFFSASCPSEYVYDQSASDGRSNQCVVFNNASGFVWTIEYISQEIEVHGIWGTGFTNVYAVGSKGTVLHSKGDGVWQTEDNATTVTLNGIWGSSESDIYAVGDRAILHSSGNGHWSVTSVPTSPDDFTNLRAIGGTGPNNIYALGESSDKGIIAHSTSFGQWSLSVTDKSLFDIWGNSDAGIYGIGAKFAQFSSTNLETSVLHFKAASAEFTTELIGDASLVTLCGNQNNIIYAAGQGPGKTTPPPGRIFKRVDGQWKLETDRLPYVAKIWVSPSGEVFAVHGLAQSISYSNGTAEWTSIAVPGERTDPYFIKSVWGSGVNDVYLTGGEDAGSIIHGKR